MTDTDKWFINIAIDEKNRVRKFVQLFLPEEYFKFCESKDFKHKHDLGSVFSIVLDNKLNDINKITLLEKYREVLLTAPESDEKWDSIVKEYRELKEALIKSQDSDPDELTNDHISHFPKDVQTRLKNVHIKTKNLSKTGSEYNKRMEWFSYIKKIPTKYKEISIGSDKKTYLKNIRDKIDQEIYAMDTAKTELLSIISSYINKKDSTNNCVALLGPPGIGKTQLIMKFIELIDMPFSKISVGNCGDDLALNGCGYAYQHSEPGMIVKAVTSMGYKSGIVLFDEIDKVKSGKIFNILLHLVDSTQNNKFEDIYLDGIPIDLSGYLFIYTLNDFSNIPDALRSRISENLIELPGYSAEEKFTIVNKYTIPKYIQRESIEKYAITFTDSAIKYIVANHNTGNAEGMREINGVLKKIIRLITYYHDTEENNCTYPMIVSAKFVKELLKGKEKEPNLMYA